MTRDKLPFVPSYPKNNPLREYHGVTYGMTQPQCNKRIRRLSDTVLKSLETLEELPDGNRLRIKYPTEQCRGVLPGGTERPIERPQDSDRQESCRSGKKHHGVKNDPLCDSHRRILRLSKIYRDRVHDRKITDEQPLALPKGIALRQDTGFIGHIPENVTVKMPTRKPGGKEPADVQKQENRKISSFRILAEHAGCGVKNVVLSKIA